MKHIIPFLTLVLFTSFVNGHGSVDLEQIVGTINQNADVIPPQVAQLLGNERINLYLEDETYGFVTRNAKIVEYKDGAIQNPTINVYTDANTITQITNGELSFDKALKQGKVKYTAIDAVTKIKLTIAEIFGSFYSLLTGAFLQPT